MFSLFCFLLLSAILLVILFRNKKASPALALPDDYREILDREVLFYHRLSDNQKLLFQDRVKDFLTYVRVHGVKTTISGLDRLLVAASAIIPIFNFPKWKYRNLTDVLLYDDVFSAGDFRTSGKDRNIAGLVGEGAMNNVMILSRQELELGFSNKTDKDNTGIHEFVHLLDKSDGATDGVPEYLMNKKAIARWVELMHHQIQAIRQGKSDINPYGATSQTEFFAVASEYFFERPELLEQKHPELFALLEEAFSDRQGAHNT